MSGERPDAVELPPDAGAFLLLLARAAIADRLRIADPGPGVRALRDRRGTPGWAERPGATFVTLTEGGRLRGCIGSLQAHRPLAHDVHENALAAGFRDPRFPPLTASEYAGVRIEVSLLTEPVPLDFVDEADAVARLRPGVDGVILSAAGRRGTFLPQVWDELPDPADFWAHLKRKAGLPPDHWGSDVRVETYGVRKWSEPPR